jgi:O-antigen/teichoic acid export membrane protein
MVSQKKISEDSYYAYIKKVMALFALISFCIIIPVSVFADEAISYTFGKTYLAAVPVVRIHIYGLYFIFLAQVLSKWLIVEELTRYSLVRSLTGLIINVVLNLILIPKMGGEGAAWATVGALAGAVVVFAGFDRHTRPFLKALLASFYIPFTFFRKHVK